jgi:hypothetical protein
MKLHIGRQLRTALKSADLWLLERSWPQEYSRVSVDRVEQIGEKADQKVGVQIYYSCGKSTLAQLLDFPVLGTDAPKVGREKQRRLLGQTEKAPEKTSDAPAPEETISKNRGVCLK